MKFKKVTDSSELETNERTLLSGISKGKRELICVINDKLQFYILYKAIGIIHNESFACAINTHTVLDLD